MTHNVLVVGPDDRVFTFPIAKDVQTATLKGWLSQKLGTASDFHLTLGGVPLRETDVIPCGEEWGTTLIRAHPLLNGGKGGFGALIRAVGSRCNRSNTKEACRDLSGRRLRDVNAQKRMTKWLEEEPERKRSKREEKRKRLQRNKVPPKHFFDDQAYMEQLRANEEDMDSALKQGLVASSHKGLKRKQPTSDASATKKAKFWVGGDEEDISSGDSEGDSEGDDSGDQEPTTSQSDQLNSAGSSDETAKSKPSDDEEDNEQCVHPNGSQEVAAPVLQEEEERRNGDECVEPLVEKEQVTSEQCSETPNSEEDRQVTDEEEGKAVMTSGTGNDEETQQTNDGPLDLNEFSSAVELESVGANRLKSVLQSLGLKCGGTLQERAHRLFATKGKSLEELDPAFFAKAGKKSRKQKKK